MKVFDESVASLLLARYRDERKNEHCCVEADDCNPDPLWSGTVNMFFMGKYDGISDEVDFWLEIRDTKQVSTGWCLSELFPIVRLFLEPIPVSKHDLGRGLTRSFSRANSNSKT